MNSDREEPKDDKPYQTPEQVRDWLLEKEKEYDERDNIERAGKYVPPPWYQW